MTSDQLVDLEIKIEEHDKNILDLAHRLARARGWRRFFERMHLVWAIREEVRKQDRLASQRLNLWLGQQAWTHITEPQVDP